jgi:ActR/RegA family two-component response regulator
MMTTPATTPTVVSPTETAIDTDWPTLDELSLRYLHRVIAHAKGNKTKAAAVLGIDRRTVSRILAKVQRDGKPPTMQTANRK